MISVMAFVAGAALVYGGVASRAGWQLGTGKGFGSARWLGLGQAGRAGLFGRKGVPIGDWGRSSFTARSAADGHILTVAPPGGGKSSTGSIPSGLSDGIHSRFITDPDGEISAVCIDYWRRRTDAHFIINPFGMWSEAPWYLPQHSFDPIAFIKPEHDGGKFARLMAATLIAQGAHDDGSTEYFKSQGAEKLEAYLIFGALRGLTLPEIGDLMGLPLEPVGTSDGLSCQFDIWEAMETIDALDGLLRREAIDLKDKLKNSPGEFQAIFSTMKDAVKFLKEPAIRRALAKNEVDWAALKTKRAVVSVVMPSRDWQLYAGFVKLAFACVIKALDDGAIARHHVHILLEEFPSLGRLPFFGDLLATGRKKKAKIEIVIQNIGQLRAIYPEWRALIPNFEVRRFKAVRDGETAQFVSTLMGRKTEQYRKALFARELLTPDEVATIPRDRQIVFIGNLRPALMGQYPYWQKAILKARALPNPFYALTPETGAMAFLRKLHALLLRTGEWIARPSPYVVLLGCALMLWGAKPSVLIDENVGKRGRIESCTWLTRKGIVTQASRYGQCARVTVFDQVLA